MKKWLLLLIVTIVLMSVLSAATVKVAVLPLKRLDSASKYIQKFLTIRDLQRTFDTNDKYEMLNLKTTADVFKDFAIEDVEAMEKPDFAEIGKELNADVVVRGTIQSAGYDEKYRQQFSITFGFYSMRTKELKTQKVIVVKEKKDRWKVLEDDFLGKLALFINDEVDKLYTLAVQDYIAENYAPSEQGLNTVLEYNPGKTEAYYYLGMIAYKNQNYNKAISDLNKSMSDPLVLADTRALEGLSQVYDALKNPDMQLVTLDKLATLQNDAEQWLIVGNKYAENNQNVKAREAMEKSLRADPKFEPAKYRLALLLYDMGAYNDAIPYLEIVAAAEPESDVIARRLAFAYQKAGRIDEAISRYESSIQSNPTNIMAYLNLAGMFRTIAIDAADAKNQARVNEYNQKTIDVLNRAKVIDPENAYIYLRFADVYMAMNRTTDAENNSVLANDKDSSLYQPYMLLSSISQKLGSDKYNQFIDLEKQAATKYGDTAKRLGNQRDAARASALTYFRRAKDQLEGANSRTGDGEILRDIELRMQALTQMIQQASKIN
jgi:tetratricopeptide (TPR) repeat protein